ncbi:rab family small GTPase, partial [Naegleria gruberi]
IHPPSDYLLRYITLGDLGIGKSTYHNIIRNGKFEIYKNIGIDFCIKTCTLPINGLLIKHQIWDTSGEERFYRNKSSYINRLLRFKQLFIYCFSMNNEESFNNLNDWFEPIKEIKGRHLELIIG